MPQIGGGYRDLKPFFRVLDDDGDGLGTVNAIGDYSSVSKTFKLIPAIDEIIIVDQILVHITDAGLFTPDDYGALSTLSNGYDIKATAPNMANESLIGGVEAIKENTDFLHWGPNAVQIINFAGPIDALVASYKLRDFGVELILDGSQGHKLEILLSDSFVGLIEHHFIVHGRV